MTAVQKRCIRRQWIAAAIRGRTGNLAESPPDFEMGVRLTGSQIQINESLGFSCAPGLQVAGSHQLFGEGLSFGVFASF